MTAPESTHRTARPGGSALRAGVWLLHLSLPVLGLWLLLAQPELDADWTHHVGHFLLVLTAATISMGIAVVVRGDARRSGDARLTLVAHTFLVPAAFFFLHGLATPQVLLAGPNSGFSVAMPVGLVLGGALAVWSSLDHSPSHAQRVVRLEPWGLAALAAVLALWIAASLAPLPPLDQPFDAEGSAPWLARLSLAGVVLYAVAAARFWIRYRRRPAVVLLSIITAYTLLGESLVAVGLSRSWHVSWWLWHLLLVFAFGFVAYSAWVKGRTEGVRKGLFAGVALEQTISSVRDEYRAALEELVNVLRDLRERGAPADLAPITARIAARFGLNESQAEVLGEAALAYLKVEALERQLDALFRRYVSPDIAETLRTEPERAELGGTTAEVTCLFADLQGFTSLSERTDPADVVAMLNRYFSRVVPVVLRNGGTVVQFIGDAVLALFNAPKPLDDHAFAAVRAALAIQEEIAELIDEHPDWPPFRIGVNTGIALVGNVGGEVRSFTAIGDTINLAARLEGLARPGQVVIGEATRAALGDRAEVEALGRVTVKGKAEAVEASVLRTLAGGATVDAGLR